MYYLYTCWKYKSFLFYERLVFKLIGVSEKCTFDISNISFTEVNDSEIFSMSHRWDRLLIVQDHLRDVVSCCLFFNLKE